MTIKRAGAAVERSDPAAEHAGMTIERAGAAVERSDAATGRPGTTIAERPDT